MNDLVVVANLTPAVVFAPGGVDPILEKIKAEARAFIPDISTPKGRDEIRSFAHKIARSKTLLDDMGKELVADLKKQTGAIDTERKRVRDELDALKEEVRSPLTQWEQAEKDRVNGHETALVELSSLASFGTPEPALEDIQTRIERVRGDNRDWQEFAARAVKARDAALSSLQSLHEAREKQEKERAELARLQKEQEEREQREREEKMKAEAAETARREAEEKAKQEAERLEAARVEEATARQEAEERAKQAELDRIAAENKARADAEAAARKAEQDRQEAEERAAQRERERIEAEKKAEAEAAAKREADRKHRAKINNEALAGLTALGLSEEQGKAVIEAIAKGQVANVRISY